MYARRSRATRWEQLRQITGHAALIAGTSVDGTLVSNDGKVQAITFNSGGFANNGDALFRVSWNEVKFDNAMNRVTVPLYALEWERNQLACARCDAGNLGIRARSARAA